MLIFKLEKVSLPLICIGHLTMLCHHSPHVMYLKDERIMPGLPHNMTCGVLASFQYRAELVIATTLTPYKHLGSGCESDTVFGNFTTTYYSVPSPCSWVFWRTFGTITFFPIGVLYVLLLVQGSFLCPLVFEVNVLHDTKVRLDFALL